MSIDPELVPLARMVAAWATGAPTWTFYLYGSRVRGDHRPDSDVDMWVDWAGEESAPGALEWWSAQHRGEFATLKALLPGRLEILEWNAPMSKAVKAAPGVLEVANVRCVVMPPAPMRKSAT